MVWLADIRGLRPSRVRVGFLGLDDARLAVGLFGVGTVRMEMLRDVNFEL